jgi:hypothetical protein
MKLTEVLAKVFAICATAPALAVLPRIEQRDREYNKKFEAGLAAPGVILVGWVTGGGGSNDEELIELENRVALAVIENPAKNTTGLDALAWTECAMEFLHAAESATRMGPPEVLLDPVKPYDLGPMSTGLVVYFINLRVRSSQPIKTAGVSQ